LRYLARPIMELNVLPNPWYSDGLQFTCTQCGNCCTGEPGFVWISEREIKRLAKYLNVSIETVRDNHCRKIGDRWALQERRNPIHGGHDCVFLKDDNHGRRSCSVYPARPLQCRTWPFWPGNLASQKAWNYAARRCHGMNTGRTFSKTEIESLQDCETWPKNPPTSDHSLTQPPADIG